MSWLCVTHDPVESWNRVTRPPARMLQIVLSAGTQRSLTMGRYGNCAHNRSAIPAEVSAVASRKLSTRTFGAGLELTSRPITAQPTWWNEPHTLTCA
jgi:hypothetical protein